jgi:hypothetical protein
MDLTLLKADRLEPKKTTQTVGCPDVGAFRRAGYGHRWRPRCVLGNGRSPGCAPEARQRPRGCPRLHQPEVNEPPGRPRAVQQPDHLIRAKAPCRSRRGGRCGTAEDDRPVMADGRTSAGQGGPDQIRFGPAPRGVSCPVASASRVASARSRRTAGCIVCSFVARSPHRGCCGRGCVG